MGLNLCVFAKIYESKMQDVHQVDGSLIKGG